MNDSTNRAPAVIITAVDQANDHREAIAALSEALGGARLFHAVGGLKTASVEDVIANPDTALDTIISAVEEDRATNEGPVILTGTGNQDFDFRIAAVTGAGVVLVAQGEGCAETAAAARIRLAVGTARQRYATPLAILAEGTIDGTVDVDVPLLPLDDIEGIRAAVTAEVPEVMTPQRFQWWLLQRAKANQRRIVLPEGDDDRILEAAHILLAEGICELTILGDPDAMKARAEERGLDISAADLWDPATSDYLEEFAVDFAELRKKKGVTLEQARETMQDISYFATMMVHKGIADGMVSGAAHTTAHTIKPSFQIIKTKPGASTVSSLFLMVGEDLLWGFADCAVLPNPSPEQLGEIAVVSADTAAKFGIDPKVALLSYSTGASGSGPDVDTVVAATARAKSLAPDAAIDGPLQFDAAMNPSTAKKKAPESTVAGQANVFVFPDLNAGNIGYKIAQRIGGAMAVGPVLQGLNKPVNDLSRGATVADIVNTVAITAIQAGEN